MKIGVTTSIGPSDKMLDRAQMIANHFEGVFCERKKRGLGKLMEEHGLTHLFIVQVDRLVLKDGQGEFFWHPGTSVIKIWDISQGKGNQLVDACGIEPGDKVLDCTLGYGSDAIVMASQVGENGVVIGLESSALMAFMTRDGLDHYEDGSDLLISAMRKIEISCVDHLDYLKQQPDSSYDIIYFDPMFQSSTEASHAMQSLKMVADHSPLSNASVREALRVCRKRVVVKEKIGSGVFKRLGIKKRVGNIRYGQVVYGILEKEDHESVK